MCETDRRRIRQPGRPEIASPATIAGVKLRSINFRAEDSAEAQRDILLAIAREINRRYMMGLENSEIRYDMEGRALSTTALGGLHDRVARGLDEPTTVYDAKGTPYHIGSYNNGEY